VLLSLPLTALALGTFPAAGTLQLRTLAPPLPTGVQGLPIVVQSAVVVAGLPSIGASGSLVLLDGSL